MTKPLPPDVAALLSSPRPDAATWQQLCKLLDAADVGSVDLDTVKEALSLWPREVPRRRPPNWNGILYNRLLFLCLDVAENEQLYNHYVGAICTSPRLRLRDGSPAVTLWRQPRGQVRLENGTVLKLGDGQPGLADLGGVMTVELCCVMCAGRKWEGRAYDVCEHPPRRLNLYVEVEVKLDGKIPVQAREYRGTSTRQLTQTEREQVQRQTAQLQRGGCYVFGERVDEVVVALAKYRDDVVARLS